MPALRAELLERPRLLDEIDIGDPQLVLVCAPAGFGKSSLVAQWLARGRAQRVAWVSLDSDDDTPAGFWNAVISGLEVVLGDPVRPLVDTVRSSFSDVRGVVLVPLVNFLASQANPLVIVLDDLHEITDELALASFDWVLRRLPPAVRVVLATRRPPDLPAIDGLRLRGAAIEIPAEQLRLTDGEARQFLTTTLGLRLADSQVEALMKALDGWPAMLYLASLALRRGQDVGCVIAHLAGADGLPETLVAEVLRTYPPELAAFLLRLAAFERFSAAAAAAVLGRPDAAVMIAQLERSNMLVIPLDPDRRWFRLHHLLRDLLRHQLISAYPWLGRELQVRAGDWFRAHGEPRAALSHYLAGEGWDQAAGMLADNLMTLVSEGARELVLSHVADMPAEWARADPRTCYVGAFITAMSGDRAASEAWLNSGRACASGATRLDGMHDWRTLETFVRAQLPFGDLGRATAACVQARELFPDESPFLPIVAWLVGKWSCLRGDWDAALAALAGARGILDRIPNEAGEVIVPAMQALTLLAMGRRGEATAFVVRALEARAATRFANDPHSLCAVVAAARWSTESGHPGEALALCEDGLSLTCGWPDTHFIVPCLLIERARAQAGIGAGDEASASLDEAERLLDGAVDAGVIPRWLAEVRQLPGVSARVADPRRWRDREDLSPRELEVLALLSSRMSAREIAGELFVSLNTLKTHCRSLYRKLDVGSREQAVARAREAGLLR